MLYVVRHGQTDWNLAKKIQGKTDIPLNENGINQAYITKKMLEDVKFVKVFSSPLQRAKKTAGIICGSEDDVVVDDRIIERYMGNLEGENPKLLDIKEIWNYERNSKSYNVEQVQNLLSRINSFLDEYKDLYTNNDVLMVTHGGIYPAIDTYFNGIPDDNQINARPIKNCEVVTYDMKNKNHNIENV